MRRFRSICFSAAVPGQGGYQHINEQFQDYWIEKFRARGYTAYDMLRMKGAPLGKIDFLGALRIGG